MNISAFDFISCVNQSINDNENAIESLDRAIGDGDHYINLKRGMGVIENQKDVLKTMDLSSQFKLIGMKILSSVGGASGPLLASFFLEFAKTYPQKEPTLKDFAHSFNQGVRAIQHRGKSNLGEKTMLDVLIPVSEKLLALTDSTGDTQKIAAEIDALAQSCAEKTKDLLPTKGRSTGLGERALGHMDPGAKSCQVIISSICNEIIKG